MPANGVRAIPAAGVLVTITGTSHTGVLGKAAHFTRKLPKAKAKKVKAKKKVAHRR